MHIIGWIRLGDKAECGGKVIEGLDNFTIHGVPTAFQGAKMACQMNCTIFEGKENMTLPNGSKQPHHGSRTTPGYCPLISSCNDVAGFGNENGAHIPTEFIKHNDEWVEAIYDEQFILRDEKQNILSEIPYTIVLYNKEKIHGTTDNNGNTERYITKKSEPIEFHIGHI